MGACDEQGYLPSVKDGQLKRMRERIGKNVFFDVRKRCSKDGTAPGTMAGGRPWGIKGRVGPSKGGTFPCTTTSH
jgi:hypothetical protein